MITSHATIATFINLNLLIENHLIPILTSPPVDFFVKNLQRFKEINTVPGLRLFKEVLPLL